MELGEIITDALAYPTKNIPALLIYIVFGVLIGLVAVATGLGSFALGQNNVAAGGILAVLGIIIIIALLFFLLGFSLDIIKFGIDRRDDAPGVDFQRHLINGMKYLLIAIVFFILPIIVTMLLFFIFSTWLATVLGVILTIIFMFAFAISTCRLANTEDIGDALNYNGIMDDFNRIGFSKIILTIVVSVIIGVAVVLIITFIVGLIVAALRSPQLASWIIPIVSAVLNTWVLFYSNRVMGLLYS